MLIQRESEPETTNVMFCQNTGCMVQIGSNFKMKLLHNQKDSQKM